MTAKAFTHYWGPEGFAGMKRGEPLSYASSGVFSERKVAKGDRLYVVTVKQGELYLLGCFTVDLITGNRSEARKRLGREPWEGAEHAFAASRGGTDFDPRRAVPIATVRQLRFVGDSGVKALRFKDATRLDQQTLRGVRQMTEASAALLDAFLGGPSKAIDAAEHAQTFEEEVHRSMGDAPSKRRERLAAAIRIPAKVTATVTVFMRNPDVVAEVLARAAGSCEQCKRPAPFKRRSDRSPYLEVHHRVQLAHGGEDTIENALALCPNCHRELHFGLEAVGAGH